MSSPSNAPGVACRVPPPQRTPALQGLQKFTSVELGGGVSRATGAMRLVVKNNVENNGNCCNRKGRYYKYEIIV
eukprot:5293495-Pyramimonas_sp.AAC.1